VPVTAAATFCATLVDEWVRQGVRHAVFSPGSRSTPLALAFAADRRIELHRHHDERSAGFVGLGIGLATGHPAVVVTTSGTAAVELHPAVVEASQAAVPLILATADRPPELWDVGAPQTVDQTRLFGTAVRWFAEPGVPSRELAVSWRPLAARSVAEAIGTPPGPVHLNLSFREPLVGAPGILPAPSQSRRRPAVLSPDPADLDELVALVAGRSGVLVAGPPIGLPGAVVELAATLDWPLLADPRSGCRTGPHAVAHADLLLRHAPFAAEARPEVVLRLGAPPASKVVSQWLAGLGCPQVAVERHGRVLDPDRTTSRTVSGDPGAVASALLDRIATSGEGGTCTSSERWRRADDAAEEAVADALGRRAGGVTEPGAVRAAWCQLPTGAAVVVASSMPVRDLEWYAPARVGVDVYANRGANGIDGVLSTAVGVAAARRHLPAPASRVLCLLGDLALLHDGNGLLDLAGRRLDLTILVLDNDGGGIFSFLPQAADLPHDRFEQLFGTPHGLDLTRLADLHGIPVAVASSDAEVGELVARSTAAGGTSMVLARTDRTANVALHRALEQAVAATL
jgi:2-succinyl-5-enolpyruvyl-6-hydroxy-3-cyclohexene-1-carboxylate synthase